jgi:hypothetical protein
MIYDINKFDFFSSRLYFIEVTDNQLMNMELWHHLSIFENYVFGIFLQYNRIKADLKFPGPNEIKKIPGPQAGLDIYYYTLTWDKLKKVYEKLKSFINHIQQDSASFTTQFINDFRLWRKRIDHLLLEFDTEIRNEYEHPSLKSYSVGSLIMWGNIMIDRTGDIKSHVGKDLFTTIKIDHCNKLQQLRIDLIDLFIKHFTKKPLTQELVKVRDYIQDNIDSICKELNDYKENESWDEFNDLLYQLTMSQVYLSKEGIQLADDIVQKYHSTIFPIH